LRDDREWLLDILEAIEKTEKYAALGEKNFFEGEPSRYPWKGIIGMRKRRRTQYYFSISLSIISADTAVPRQVCMFMESSSPTTLPSCTRADPLSPGPGRSPGGRMT